MKSSYYSSIAGAITGVAAFLLITHLAAPAATSQIVPDKEVPKKPAANTAQFNDPKGMAVDSAGNVFVADTGNSTIRKITPAGTVTTLAGNARKSPIAGTTTDGAGSAALFMGPRSIAIDRQGNLYVVEARGCYGFRKITPDGVVSSFGQREQSLEGDNFPSIAVDAAGNVYILDDSMKCIRKVTSDGVITTLAGQSENTISELGRSALKGLVVDSAGNLFVTDAGWIGRSRSARARIRKVTPAGVVSTFAGGDQEGHADGLGSAAQFYKPVGIAIDRADNLYVLEAESVVHVGDYPHLERHIRKVTPAGVVSTFISVEDSLAADGGLYSSPLVHTSLAIAVDAAGNLYVTTQTQVFKITPQEGIHRTMSAMGAKGISVLAGSDTVGSADSAAE